MAVEQPYLLVPRGLTREVTTYLQTLQNMVMDLAGYRETSRRAIRLTEALDYINKGKMLPEALAGQVQDGESVRLGNYIGKPVVIATGWKLEFLAHGLVSVRIKNLRPDNNDWVFEAECQCRAGDEIMRGNLDYLAIGRREYA